MTESLTSSAEVITFSLEEQLAQKDQIILELTTQLHNLRLQYLAEQELLKNSVKNLTATLSLLNLDFTLENDEFLESVISQIEKLKSDETTEFLFSKTSTNFVGVEPKRNFDTNTDANSLKDLVKNYFSK